MFPPLLIGHEISESLPPGFALGKIACYQIRHLGDIPERVSRLWSHEDWSQNLAAEAEDSGRDILDVDGLHLSIEGHRLLAGMLLQTLK